MATKTMTLGDDSTTVNLSANGNVVGANITSKGSASTPVYFDANGVAQECTAITPAMSPYTHAEIDAYFGGDS